MKLAVAAAAAFLLALAPRALSQDYEREKRWADEVAPGLVVGDSVWIEAASGKPFLGLYAPVRDARATLVIIHGIGVHPDHGVIGVLRGKLTDRGYTTLSIQMPVLAADKRAPDYYPRLFPDALDRIARGAAWLRARGQERLVLVTHGMGAWMANEYLDATPESPYVAWVCMGLTGGYSWATYFSRRPILDIYGENDIPPTLEAAWRRRMTLATTGERSRQVMIAEADHFYAKREEELARAIDAWLREAL